MKSFEEVNQTELEQVEGGIGAFVAGFIVGMVFVGGVAVGIQLTKGECTK